MYDISTFLVNPGIVGSNWVLARVSVITAGNKAPGDFGNHVIGTKQAKL
jgi:hypothetical protein